MKLLAAITIAASLVTPLTGLAGPIYQCRIDGDWRASCCCEQEAACGEPTLASDALRECGCCTVVRFESRDPSPIVASPTDEGRRGPAAAPGLAHFASAGLIATSAPQAAIARHSLPLAASVFLENSVLRL